MKNSAVFSKDWRVKIGALGMALAIVVAAVTVGPTRADAYRYGRRHWRRHRHVVIYAPAPRAYYQPDVYYAPPPVVYAPPPPPGRFTFIFPFRIR